MLLKLPVQGILGMSAPVQNAGSVENTGFDLNISTIIESIKILAMQLI